MPAKCLTQGLAHKSSSNFAATNITAVVWGEEMAVPMPGRCCIPGPPTLDARSKQLLPQAATATGVQKYVQALPCRPWMRTLPWSISTFQRQEWCVYLQSKWHISWGRCQDAAHSYTSQGHPVRCLRAGACLRAVVSTGRLLCDSQGLGH